MLETEELGVSIMHDLHQQRQSLLHANDTASNISVNSLYLSIALFLRIIHFSIAKYLWTPK